ncbi:LuxR C-terminal-related transcriptional regulator [Photobacterium rosenbergii]|uniref:LuxR C-terminal-related transcriptional regulator n=1 Tax=Photobacterium rosenbergii TaxID=294936 RepID=A0ABU3ZG05_9GAMM|nr:LuxR C-terminal-related transcriptional regulator [Photobacterium rosenbergii]MDV5168992.1 LuxR C-terminal-related transcriptional regulator [Photobacterium rosenbergii]
MSSSHFKHIFFICDSSLQSCLFKDFLEKSLNKSIDIMTFDKFVSGSYVRPDESLVIIDFTYINDEKHQSYYSYITQNELETKEVLINTPQETDYKILLGWPNITGVFYSNNSLEIVEKGMKCILDGEMWLSRSLSQKIILSYRQRSQLKFNIKPHTNLTTREKEILDLLILGESNEQIAASLFVSENTVKSHLHNVFKKINAKNRVQAFMWAKNNYYNDMPI